eukprot:1428818-Prymnesium_polylepis.3
MQVIVRGDGYRVPARKGRLRQAELVLALNEGHNHLSRSAERAARTARGVDAAAVAGLHETGLVGGVERMAA